MSRRRDDRLRAARTGRKRTVNRQPVIRPDEVGQTGGPASLDDALLLQWIESRVRAGVKPSVLAAYALLAGAAFTGDVTVPDEAYGSGWNGSTEVPTKNALYDKIETLGGVTSVGGSSPISSSGGSTPTISIANAAADGSTKGAAAFNSTDFTASSGVVSSTAKYHILVAVLQSVTPTTSGINTTAVSSQTTIPRTGSYKFRFTFRITSVSGTPSTITITSNAGSAISRVPANSGSGSFSTIIAANTVTATIAKGSTFAAGDCYYGESSSVSLTAGDNIVAGNGANALFNIKVNNATSVSGQMGIELVEQ